MKKTILILIFGFITSVSFGQTRHPYYGGGHHTSSHGGYYSGGHGLSHRGGHYINRRTYNTYGRHKRHSRTTFNNEFLTHPLFSNSWAIKFIAIRSGCVQSHDAKLRQTTKIWKI